MSALTNVAETITLLLSTTKEAGPTLNEFETSAQPPRTPLQESQIQKAEDILFSGAFTQRLNIIKQLPNLFSIDKQECMDHIIPQLSLQLRRDDPELHKEVANAYHQLLIQRVIEPSDYAASFLPTVLQYLNRGDRVVFNIWFDHLIEVICILPTDMVHKKIFPVTVTMSQLSAQIFQKAAAAKLLGRMCRIYDRHRVMKDVLPLIHSLSQDIASEVRASACQQFPALVKDISDDVIRTSIIPSLIELARDENESVQAEAVQTITLMLPVLSMEVKRSTIVPLIYSICQRTEGTVDEVSVRLAKHFADLLIGLEPVLPLVSKQTMVRYYCDFASLGAHSGKRLRIDVNADPDVTKARIVECRRLCAENFSKLAKFANSEQHIWQKLLRAFVDFSNDPNHSVRRTTAANLHEVSSSAGERIKVVRRVLISLLKDPVEDVLAGLTPNLAATIENICLSGIFTSDQDPARFELASAMTCAILTLENSYNWRLVEDLFRQLECAVRFLPSNYIYTHLVPLMFQRMHQAKAKPIQLAAGRTQLCYLRYNLKKVQREKIKSRLDAEFCRSRSCHDRILYLKLCDVARDLFSTSYFKHNFLMPILSLADDPVPNCRLLVAQRLTSLKFMASGDGKFDTEVHKAYCFMNERETDVDVKEALAKFKTKERPDEELDKNIDRAKYDEERKLAAIYNSNTIADPPGAKPEKPTVIRSAKRTVERHPTKPGEKRLTFSASLDLSNASTNTNSMSGGSSLSSRTNTFLTNRLCTCMLQSARRTNGKPSLNMEISWLNLETELHEELVALTGENCNRRQCPCMPVFKSCDSSIFSAAFERDFYRDTGVHVFEIMGSVAKRTGSLQQQQPNLVQKTLKVQKTTEQPKFLAVNGRSKSFYLPTTKISEDVTVKPLTRIPVAGMRTSSHRRSLDVTHMSRVCDVRNRGSASSAVNGGSRLPVRKRREDL